MAVTYNILDLGKSHYNDAWKLQKRLQSQRISGQIDDQLLLVEHFPVYTLGKNTPREHLLTKESDNISIIHTDRANKHSFSFGIIPKENPTNFVYFTKKGRQKAGL